MTPEKSIQQDERAAERECERRMLGVLYGLDEFDYVALLAQFRGDGVWHRNGASLAGHAAISAALDQRPKSVRVRHLMSNFMLRSCDEQSASASFYMTAYWHETGGDHPPPTALRQPLGVYIGQVSLRRDAGRWLIAELAMPQEFSFA